MINLPTRLKSPPPSLAHAFDPDLLRRLDPFAVALNGYDPRRYDLQRTDGSIIEDARPKRRKRKPSLATVAKQAAKAGLTVTGIEYRADGSVTYLTGKPTPGIVSLNDNDDDGISTDPGWH